MNEKSLLACIDWVRHGFEIDKSIFPGWKFSAPDTVVAFGHGALVIGLVIQSQRTPSGAGPFDLRSLSATAR
jgi:hypothetical protein